MDDHIPAPGKMVTARCEPPPELRGVDGAHWLKIGNTAVVYEWYKDHQCWLDGAYDRYASDMYRRGFRYLAPVTTPAEVEALRAEVMRAGAECADAMSQVATLRARVAKLEGAVRYLRAFPAASEAKAKADAALEGKNDD